MRTKQIIETEINWDGEDFTILATLDRDSSKFNSDGLDVEFESITNEAGKEVLEDCEWAMYNDFEAYIIDNY